jgi:hypothetical protein
MDDNAVHKPGKAGFGESKYIDRGDKLRPGIGCVVRFDERDGIRDERDGMESGKGVGCWPNSMAVTRAAKGINRVLR